MPRDQLKADAGALSTAAKYVAAARDDFLGKANALSAQITGYETSWKGAGGSAFFQLHQAWTDKQKRIISALNDFEASLHSTDRDNVSTDDSQRQANTKLHDRLTGL